MTEGMCRRCGEPFPRGEPCPGCGEPVTAIGFKDFMPDAPWTCHGLLPVSFDALNDGRYRAIAFDGAVLHTCLTEKQRAEIAELIETDPAEWYSQLVADHADGAVRREDVEGEEAWNRLSGEPHLFGVEAMRLADPPGWQVSFWVLEYVREEPLESRLRSEIERHLRAVTGVLDVQEEDREVYWITGAVSGEQLAIAGAAAVDSLTDELRSHYNALNS